MVTTATGYYGPNDRRYYAQGDVVLAPSVVLDANPPPNASRRDASARGAVQFDGPSSKPVSAAVSLQPVMIISHSCTLDKEFNRRVKDLRADGKAKREAETEAGEDPELDRYVAVAPVIPVREAAPSAPNSLMANEVLGFFPVPARPDLGIDEGVADLSRCCTVDRMLFSLRLGVLTSQAQSRLIYALARFWAYRAPRLTAEIEAAIGKRIKNAEVTSGGDLGIVLTLSDGERLSFLQAPDVGAGAGGAERPGL